MKNSLKKMENSTFNFLTQVTYYYYTEGALITHRDIPGSLVTGICV